MCFQILKHFNLEIPAGKTVALVGPSGVGKSTVIDLFLRLYDCNGGVVSIFTDNFMNVMYILFYCFVHTR